MHSIPVRQYVIMVTHKKKIRGPLLAQIIEMRDGGIENDGTLPSATDDDHACHPLPLVSAPLDSSCNDAL